MCLLALVAQWIEHLVAVQGVAGSIPAERTRFCTVHRIKIRLPPFSVIGKYGSRIFCPRRIMDKTSPSEGGNAGSIPAEDTGVKQEEKISLLSQSEFFFYLGGAGKSAAARR